MSKEVLDGFEKAINQISETVEMLQKDMIEGDFNDAALVSILYSQGVIVSLLQEIYKKLVEMSDD